MALSDLTDRSAVLQAIEEFDALGREAFLRRYGFGPARRFYLRHDDRLYDSKAVVGAAHGFQHPAVGPLRAVDFSGGDATVRRKLESLGFTVEVTDAPETRPSSDTLADLEQAVQAELENSGTFSASDVTDARRKTMAAIVRRRGQRAFREALMRAYGGRCAITGCTVREILEAAHIYPYRGDATNHVMNGPAAALRFPHAVRLRSHCSRRGQLQGARLRCAGWLGVRTPPRELPAATCQ